MEQERKLVLAAAGKLVPYFRGQRTVEQPKRIVSVFAERRSKDANGKTVKTALFICDEGVWDNGTKQVIRKGPVSVPWGGALDPDDFYPRAAKAGDIVVVEEKSKDKASRGSDAATRKGAGGEV